MISITSAPVSSINAFGYGFACDRKPCPNPPSWVVIEDGRKPTQAKPYPNPIPHVATYCDAHRDDHGPLIPFDLSARLAADNGQGIPFYAACHANHPRPTPIAAH